LTPFLNNITNSMSNTLTEHLINRDISLNSLDNRGLQLEYSIVNTY